MSGNIGNGAASLLKDKNDALEARNERAQGWMKRAKGLLGALALGLMLACGPAYASEPSSPVPVTMTKNKVNHTNPTQNIIDSSPAMGDAIFDWSIGIFVVIIGAFFSINFLDSKEKGSK